MPTRFLLGPAGSGKTFRCLHEARAALHRPGHSAGELLFVAPKQATFQIERQLLADPSVPGYTRLKIVSFERLAEFVLGQMGRSAGKILSEEGRIMVLRSLLSRERSRLNIFRSSARLPGFARELSANLHELQDHQLSPARLRALAAKSPARQLSAKLMDLALILEGYLAWLESHQLVDADRLLTLATAALRDRARTVETPLVDFLWLDGFAEMTPQELDLLGALVPACRQSTLAFCLEAEPSGATEELRKNWLSIWSTVAQTYRRCHARLAAIPGHPIMVEVLPRSPVSSRFAGAPALAHVERNWMNPSPFTGGDAAGQIRLARCADPEAETILAAREILAFVRAGGRFRDCAVLLRSFPLHQPALRRTFNRYGIPFFLDQRESAGHHPLAELTRSALRLALYGWRHDDWFGALKSGLVTDDAALVDRLENEALAQGWTAAIWQSGDGVDSEALRRFQKATAAPVQKWMDHCQRLRSGISGTELATALRRLWSDLNVADTLDGWGPAQHSTVLKQLESILENVVLAFADERLPLAEWLPILEAALNGLTVGLVPPSLDQVLIGTIDRSRNPELRLALVLGLNEAVFPDVPTRTTLLNDLDRARLEGELVFLGQTRRELLSRERYYGYIACTRSGGRLVASCALADDEGAARNPSVFFSHLQKMFPGVEVESFEVAQPWQAATHPSEAILALWKILARNPGHPPVALAQFPGLQSALAELGGRSQPLEETISRSLALRLYGSPLKTSVSRLEQFAACPFRFFIVSGLRARERERLELDSREQGSFQHAVLARFHEELGREKKRWRDLSPDEARQRIARVAAEEVNDFRDGLLLRDASARFTATHLARSLQEFVAVLVAWMKQYDFDPQVAELGFGVKEERLPAWNITLSDDRSISFRGVIDRIDVVQMENGEALAIVMDYKSSRRRLDPLLVANGIQLQLLAYLGALKTLPGAAGIFGSQSITPVGVFYVNLRGEFTRARHRGAALAEDAGESAFQHHGRFNADWLARLDNRGQPSGTQFRYRLKNDGAPYKNCDAVPAAEFSALVAGVEEHLRRMGMAIFDGDVRLDPFQKGRVRACDDCDYGAVCRIDPWNHSFRVLRAPSSDEA